MLGAKSRVADDRRAREEVFEKTPSATCPSSAGRIDVGSNNTNGRSPSSPASRKRLHHNIAEPSQSLSRSTPDNTSSREKESIALTSSLPKLKVPPLYQTSSHTRQDRDSVKALSQ